MKTIVNWLQTLTFCAGLLLFISGIYSKDDHVMLDGIGSMVIAIGSRTFAKYE